MCQSPLHPFLAALPKCEHHMHLEGALTPALLFSLAAKNNVTLPADTSPAFSSPEALLARYSAFTSLSDFLEHYYIGMSALITEYDFEALAASYFATAHANGVRHAELFYDPQAHTSRGISHSTVLAGFSAARTRAHEQYGISSLLIPCFLRHLPPADADATFEQHLRGALSTGSIVGVGLDSAEAGFPPEPFAPVFAKASAAGARLTAHAGEECGPESVRGALDALRVERIDHGRAIARDSALMREVAARKLLVTMCPLSNVCLRGVSSVAEMPVREFLQAGVRFSLNSDDPAYFGGFVLGNYCAVQEAFGLGLEEWVGVAKGAIEGSWCGEGRKAELREEVEGCVRRFEKGELGGGGGGGGGAVE